MEIALDEGRHFSENQKVSSPVLPYRELPRFLPDYRTFCQTQQNEQVPCRYGPVLFLIQNKTRLLLSRHMGTGAVVYGF